MRAFFENKGVLDHVFELAEGNIVRVASGERIGTIVTTREEA